MDKGVLSGVIVLIGTVIFFKGTNAITCFNCDGVSDVSQCMGYSSVIPCQQDEVCFMEKKLSSSFQPVYVAGCKAIKFCTINSCQKAVFGDATSNSKNSSKRAGEEDLTLCSECCYDNNCNIELCGAKLFAGKNVAQCFDCKDWYKDTVCDRSVDCDLTTHSCLVQRYVRSAHANSFDMGCMRRQQCKILEGLSGERHDNYTKCCDKHLCNGNPRIPSVDKNLIAMHFDCPTNLVHPNITTTTKAHTAASTPKTTPKPITQAPGSLTTAPTAAPTTPPPTKSQTTSAQAPTKPTTTSTAAPETPSTAAPMTPSTAAPTTPSTASPTTPSTAAPTTPSTAAPTTPSTAAPTTPTTLTTTVASTAPIVRASTEPPLKTIPPVTTMCHTCAGPAFLCEKLHTSTPCAPPNNYCINKIMNHKDGTRDVERSCGNFDTCYREWFQGTSDNDKCRQFDGSQDSYFDFQCTFCCVKDNCNDPLKPNADTLYKGA